MEHTNAAFLIAAKSDAGQFVRPHVHTYLDHRHVEIVLIEDLAHRTDVRLERIIGTQFNKLGCCRTWVRWV